MVRFEARTSYKKNEVTVTVAFFSKRRLKKSGSQANDFLNLPVSTLEFGFGELKILIL